MISILQTFLLDQSPDSLGRWRQDLLISTNTTLEKSHNIVQWLLPSERASHCQPGSPVMNETLYLAMQEDSDTGKTLRANVLENAKLFLTFWGLHWDGNRVISHPILWKNSENWLRPRNHNHLRMSRCMRALTHAGHLNIAEGLKNYLIFVVCSQHPAIANTSQRFWAREITEAQKYGQKINSLAKKS